MGDKHITCQACKSGPAGAGPCSRCGRRRRRLLGWDVPVAVLAGVTVGAAVAAVRLHRPARAAPPAAATAPSPVVASRPLVVVRADLPRTTSPTLPTTVPSPAVVATPAVIPLARPVERDPVPATAVAVAAPPLPPPRRPALRSYPLPGAVTDAQVDRAVRWAIYHLRVGRWSQADPAEEIREFQATFQTDPLRPGRQLMQVEIGGEPPALPADAPLVRDFDWKFSDKPFGDTTLGTWAPLTLLPIYALLSAGQATGQPGLGPHDPAVVDALQRVKGLTSGDDSRSRALRAAVLGVYARPEDRAVLDDDVRWLVAHEHHGSYWHWGPGDTRSSMDRSYNFWKANHGVYWDNFDSQIGQLGVEAGTGAEVPVPASYWQDVIEHWAGCETADGQWGMDSQTPWPYRVMTLAGTAALLAAHQRADAAAGRPVRPPQQYPGVDRALAWLAQGDHAMVDGSYSGMGTFEWDADFGLAQVGQATGWKYLGTHDWYRERAAKLVAGQLPGGSWGPIEEATAYNLMFLARRHHPLLFDKLRYDGGHCDTRPYDAADLARFATARFERPMDWQAVDLHHGWADWTDAPVLYIAGDAAPAMTDADLTAVGDYARAGGLVVTHADGGSPAFSRWVRETLVRRAFPQYELTRVPADHPLYTDLYRVGRPPPLEAVDAGGRLLLVHSPVDLAGRWRTSGAGTPEAQLGLNLFVYAAGKTDYRNRLDSTFVPDPPPVPPRQPPPAAVPVARLRYAGAWDPEPYAWTRFARAFGWDTAATLDVRTTDLKSLAAGATPIAFLTGTVRQDFTAAEATAAKAYVAAGGVLVVDACGGREPFAKSVRATLLAGVPLAPLSADHPVLMPTVRFAQDAREMKLRPFAREALNETAVPIEGAPVGKGWVLFSRLDLTTGLLGTQTWGVLGYDPAYAQAVVENAVLWAAARSGITVAPPDADAADRATPVRADVGRRTGPPAGSAGRSVVTIGNVPLPTDDNPVPSIGGVTVALAALKSGSIDRRLEGQVWLLRARPTDDGRAAVLATIGPLAADASSTDWTGMVSIYCRWAGAADRPGLAALLATVARATPAGGPPSVAAQRAQATAAVCSALLRVDPALAVPTINARIAEPGFRSSLAVDLFDWARGNTAVDRAARAMAVRLDQYRPGMTVAVGPP